MSIIKKICEAIQMGEVRKRIGTSKELHECMTYADALEFAEAIERRNVYLLRLIHRAINDSKNLQKDIEERYGNIHSEDFIDTVVDRIKRKQL